MKNLSRIKPQSRTDLVVDKITNLIINGELSEGELLPPENKLCEIFGVSRSILREAIRVLATKGLVEVRSGYGTLARAPKDEIPEEALSNYLKANSISLLQPMEIRIPIEIEAAKLAAERREEKHITMMEEALQIMRSPSKTLEMYVRADDDFHEIIVAATHNPIFGIVLRPLMRYLHLSRQLIIQHFGLSIGIEEHQAIFESIKEKDVISAAKRMEEHMGVSLSRLKEISKFVETDRK
jgi:GntR family transcriptional repressor for pyruvate dehydrogenase complex